MFVLSSMQSCWYGPEALKVPYMSAFVPVFSPTIFSNVPMACLMFSRSCSAESGCCAK